MGQRTWHFRDTADEQYPFVQIQDVSKDQLSQTVVNIGNIHLRTDEGTILTPEQRKVTNDLLEKYQTIFDLGGEPTNAIEHCINTAPEQVPISVPPYRMAQAKKEVLQHEIDKMLQMNIIEECDSPWAAPVVLVSKPDGSQRVCVDYRRLNSVTPSDQYPMPRIDDLLHEAKKTAYMTTIDLRTGYWQIPVRDCDRNKTAFITPFGTYRFRRMPFGLKNAPATFQRLMDRFRISLPKVHLLVYIDDLILLSDRFETHILDLECVFQKLIEFGLRAKREKCHFCKNRVQYLGHIITPEGLETNPTKIHALTNRPPPRNVKELTSILQACSWYRRYIKNYADVTRPLSRLLKSKAQWTWGKTEQDTYETLMRLLTTAPVLRQADRKLPYTLRTDASDYALGAVLAQGEGAEEHPVEYASRLLTPAERNYTTTEREALAIVWSLQKFRGYLECSKITLATDHQPLRWLMTIKTPTGRLARWALQIQMYDLNIQYTPGRINVVADCLSRPPRPDDETPNNISINSVTADFPSRSAEELRDEQMKDPDVKKIIDAFEEHPPGNEFVRWSERGYIMMNGVLYHYDQEADHEKVQLVIPMEGRAQVLKELHDSATSGHNGVERTLHRITRHYYWPGIRRYVTEYIRKCVDCQKYKPTNQKPAGLLQTPPYAKRMEVITIDFFGPLPETKSQNRWILVVEDYCTRWTELFAMKQATAFETAKILTEEIFFRYGLSRRILSDNGTQFISEIMQQLTHILGIRQSLIATYHPEANRTERKNRDLKPQLAILVQTDHTTWDEELPAIRFAMNTGVCHSTGHTAAFLMFGREMRTTFDVHHDLTPIVEADNFVPLMTPYLIKLGHTLNEAKENFEKEQERQKRYSDLHRRPAPAYEPGDRILLKVHQLSNAAKGVTAKMLPKREGPYQIFKIITPTTYEIEDPNNPGTALTRVHTSDLTPYIEDEDHPNQNPAPIVERRKRGRPRKKAIQSFVTVSPARRSEEPEGEYVTPRNLLDSAEKNKTNVRNPDNQNDVRAFCFRQEST